MDITLFRLFMDYAPDSKERPLIDLTADDDSEEPTTRIDAQSVGSLLAETREKLSCAISQQQRINEDIASLKTSIQLYYCMSTLGAGGDLSREITRSKEELIAKYDKLRDLSADIARFQQQLRSFTESR